MFSKQEICLLLSAVCCFLYLPSLNASPLHYLYINAREGSASGGHTALRFDNETFHFQHYDGGIIRLVRHASLDFDFQYRYLDNRTVHQATIELNNEHYLQLRRHFNVLFLQQKQQDDLLKEINLNLSLLQQQAQHPLLNIKGAGLLEKVSVPRETEAFTVHRLQQLIKNQYGDTYLSEQILSLNKEIKALSPRPWPKESLQLNDQSFLPVPYSYASQHIDAVSKLLFLQTIKQGASLNKDHYFTPEQPAFKLSASETEQLKVFQNTLINNLLYLIHSKRPDWGSAAFILYARILSISLSIDSGTLMFLDSFDIDSNSIPYSEVATYRSLLQEQKSKALKKIIQKKQQLLTAQQSISEKAYSRLEMLSNYYFEREKGLIENRSIKVSGEQLLPTKSIPLPDHLFPRLTTQQSKDAIHRLKHYQVLVTQQMQALYDYNLFTRNCVTEIFSAINMADINDKNINEIEQLTKNNLIAFIPFGSFYSLSKDYPRKILPSFRQQQLEKMYQQENSSLVFLRETNTLSAHNYKFNDQDSVFLFFTDDNLWLRPILGSANIVTATAISIYGSLALPFDSGKTLKNGAMGILMSLPELAFFNIRKGSYKHLSP